MVGKGAGAKDEQIDNQHGDVYQPQGDHGPPSGALVLVPLLGVSPREPHEKQYEGEHHGDKVIADCYLHQGIQGRKIAHPLVQPQHYGCVGSLNRFHSLLRVLSRALA